MCTLGAQWRGGRRDIWRRRLNRVEIHSRLDVLDHPLHSGRQPFKMRIQNFQRGQVIHFLVERFIPGPGLTVGPPHQYAFGILQLFLFARQLLEIFLVILGIVRKVQIARSERVDLHPREERVLRGHGPDEVQIQARLLLFRRSSWHDWIAHRARAFPRADPAAAIALHKFVGFLGVMATRIDEDVLHRHADPALMRQGLL